MSDSPGLFSDAPFGTNCFSPGGSGVRPGAKLVSLMVRVEVESVRNECGVLRGVINGLV